jgi:hypothetical protein
MYASGLIHAPENSRAICFRSSAIVLQLAKQYSYTLSLIAAPFYTAARQLLALNFSALVAGWLDKVASDAPKFKRSAKPSQALQFGLFRAVCA